MPQPSSRRILRRLLPAATLALVLSPAAQALDRCRTAAADDFLRPVLQPVSNGGRYRLVDDGQFRLADTTAFRLVDEAQYRLGGAPRCLPPLGRHAALLPLPGGDVYQPSGAMRAGMYHALIRAAALAQGLQPELLHAVITVESGYNPRARSPKGAQGLMQLMPQTAARFAVTNAYDPAQNLAGGSRYLSLLLQEFDNDLKLALAAYNAGEDAVRRYSNRIPPYPETRAYVQLVLNHYRRLNHP